MRDGACATDQLGRRRHGCAMHALVEQLAPVLGLEHDRPIAIAFITAGARFRVTATFDRAETAIGRRREPTVSIFRHRLALESQPRETA